jgi:carboxymethylenebutenolidase
VNVRMTARSRCNVLKVALAATVFALVFSFFPICTFAQKATEPTEVTFQSGNLVLHGFLYKPEGPGPFPAVLWNHGSERKPGWLPDLAPFFLAHGYVLFIPHRRGQGRSPGDYIMDSLAMAGQAGGAHARDERLVELMEAQLQDQIAALEYLKNVPEVDGKRIFVAGCSFGGIQTVLMAEKGLGVRAAVDFAGAAQNWDVAPQLRQRMLTAVRNAQMPIFFIQAKNDYDTTPSRELATAMQKAGKAHDLEIFPEFGKGHQEAHEFCVHGSDVWGSKVLAFFDAAVAQQ